MKRLLQLTLVTLVLLVVFWGVKGIAMVLLVQDADVWTYNDFTVQPYEVLDDLGIVYQRVGSDAIANIDLSGYDFIVLEGSANNTTYYVDNIIPNMDKISDYISGGGLAIIHFADWGDSSITVMGPDGLSRQRYNSDNLTIVPGMEEDPLFRNVTNDSIDGWGTSAHGYFDVIPQTAQVLITNENNDPVYVRYPVGNGQVWATTMTLEWGAADQDIIYNEFSLAKDATNAEVVPEPNPWALMIFGIFLIAIAFYKERAILG